MIEQRLHYNNLHIAILENGVYSKPKLLKGKGRLIIEKEIVQTYSLSKTNFYKYITIDIPLSSRKHHCALMFEVNGTRYVFYEIFTWDTMIDGTTFKILTSKNNCVCAMTNAETDEEIYNNWFNVVCIPNLENKRKRERK